MRAERALKGADPCIRIAVRKITIATLAVRTDVEHVGQPDAIPNSALPQLDQLDSVGSVGPSRRSVVYAAREVELDASTAAICATFSSSPVAIEITKS